MTALAAQDALRSSPFFADIEPDDLDALAAGARYADYPSGQRVFGEGDPATRLYILVGGSIRLSVSGPAVDAVVPRPEPLMTIRHAGHPIGWSALVEPYVFRATATALEPTRLLALDRELLDQCIRERPMVGAALMRAVLGVVGDRLRAVRMRLVARRYDDTVLAIRSLLDDSGAQLHAGSPLHKLPHHLEHRLTLDDAFHVIDLMQVDGDDVERPLAEICAELLQDVRRELWLYQKLQAIYDAIASAPPSMPPDEIRARSMHEFRELFAGTSHRIVGRELLPDRPGHIFVMNHLVNHPDNLLPNGFILTLDTHFVASMILYPHYGAAPVRIIRKARPHEHGHQRFYDRLGYIYVYSGHVDPEAEQSAPEEPRRAFLETAAAHLRNRTNIVICPEGTSASTEDSPLRLRRGAFQLAAAVDPEPLIVPIAVANFDKKLMHTTTCAVVHESFRLSASVSDPADDAALLGFLNDDLQPRFRRWVREAAELAHEP
jgi:CRP-like cAMP-binding protein/1-acyl-sn-glycerol-3-phosphate acyltransferase